MRVVWSPQAIEDRDSIWEYIAADDPSAAAKVDADFEAAVDRLENNPEIARPVRVQGTRELFPIHHYRIVYEIVGNELWVLTIMHTARPWPR